MSPERIREILNTQPFQPFTVHTGDGKTVDVLSKEFAFLPPRGRTLIVVEPKVPDPREEDEYRTHFVDVFLITKVTTPAERRGRKKYRKAS